MQQTSLLTFIFALGDDKQNILIYISDIKCKLRDNSFPAQFRKEYTFLKRNCGKSHGPTVFVKIILYVLSYAECVHHGHCTITMLEAGNDKSVI